MTRNEKRKARNTLAKYPDLCAIIARDCFSDHAGVKLQARKLRNRVSCIREGK